MNEIFSDIVDEIGRKIQKTDTTYETKIKDFFNDQYERVWNKYLWKSAIVFNEAVVATSGSADLYLPKTVGEILAITQRTTPQILVPFDVHVFHRNYIDDITTQSPPIAYVPAGEFSVKAQPSTSAQIQILSSTADTATVRIWGISGGEEITELLTLNGTTPVSSTNSYTQINRIAKTAATTGTVTVRQITANTTLATLAPSEVTVRHIRLNLFYVPNTNITLYLAYKKLHRRLVYDQDIVEIPVLGPLKKLTYAQCLKEQRQFEKATLEENGALADLEDFISRHELSQDKEEVAQPTVVPFDPDVYGYEEI